MDDQFFMDDLMGRIRSLVRTEAKGTTTAASAVDQIVIRLRERLPVTDPEVAGVYKVGAVGEILELTDLRVALESCVNVSAMVGEINPRHPGFLNDRIQSVKRLMRRSLGWYTRPLRLFHRAVIHTLQQFAAALENQQEILNHRALQKSLLETNQRLSDVEQGTCQLYELTTSAMETNLAQAQATSVEVKVLREELQELRAELVATRRQIEEALSEGRSPNGPYSNKDSREMGYVATRSKHAEQDRV